jgi:hypothetical protein
MLILGTGDDDALDAFKRNWPQLWPDLLTDIKSMYQACKLGKISSSRRWLAEGWRVGPDGFMSDKSDWYLSFDLDPLLETENGLPNFDFWLKGTTIVHCQPVF